MPPNTIQLFYNPPGNLRMTVDDRSYPAVKLFLAWPLTSRTRHLSLVDSKGDEITLVERLEDLPAESREVAEEEIRRRYLTARITRLNEVRTEFGVTYWDVDTDRGRRDFVVQSLSESCVWLADGHLLIFDVDGSRYEIPNLAELDAGSLTRLDAVL